MTEIQYGVTHTEASAEKTQDWKENDTITVSATVRHGENSSDTSTFQLTEEAAQALLSDLLRITAPEIATTHDVRAVFVDGGSAEFVDVGFENRGDRYVLIHRDCTKVYIERRDLSYIERSPHREG